MKPLAAELAGMMMVSPGGNTVRQQPAMPPGGGETKQREVGAAVVKMEPLEYFPENDDAFMPDGEN